MSNNIHEQSFLYDFENIKANYSIRPSAFHEIAPDTFDILQA